MKITIKKLKQKKSALALLGGTPVLTKPLPTVYNIGKAEIAAALKVLKHGPLSDFVGVPGPKFLGGKEVLGLESDFTKRFKVKHAVSFNSATTALHAAIVALSIGPGDEVIVSPYTMSASAMVILANGAVPIFADVDPDTFCIDPKSVRSRITKRTKAIMVVNIFGLPADFSELLAIAKEYDLRIIEDNAQSPGAKWEGTYAGGIGDVGVFSFNVHKMIQAGEGGVLMTNNPKYALRAQLCRNHGESVVEGIPEDVGPIIGSNYRMTELVAAIARVQLKRLDFFTKKREELVRHLTKGLAGIPGLILPKVPKGITHAYYVYPMKVDEKILGISRNRLNEALTAEGFGVGAYVRPLYLLKVFQEQKAFNDTHFPFKSNYYDGKPDYSKGSCPVVERLYEKELANTNICQYPYTKAHVDLFVKAVKKVLKHKAELA